MRLTIPDGVDFSDLRLTRSASGDVDFDTAPLERICQANGIALQTDDDAAALMTAWYRAHRAAGGAPDPVADDLIAEAEAEDRLGGGFSHQPGSA